MCVECLMSASCVHFVPLASFSATNFIYNLQWGPLFCPVHSFTATYGLKLRFGFGFCSVPETLEDSAALTTAPGTVPTIGIAFEQTGRSMHSQPCPLSFTHEERLTTNKPYEGNVTVATPNQQHHVFIVVVKGIVSSASFRCEFVDISPNRQDLCF